MHSADIILMATFFHPILPTFRFSQQQKHPHQRVRSDPFLAQLRHPQVLTRQRAAVPRSAMTQQGWRDTAPGLLPPSDSPLAAGWKSRRGAGREGERRPRRPRPLEVRLNFGGGTWAAPAGRAGGTMPGAPGPAAAAPRSPPRRPRVLRQPRPPAPRLPPPR